MSEASENTAKAGQSTDDDDVANAGSNDVVAVKSNAVLKFSAVQTVNFSKLKCNTDLNLPPNNWLMLEDGGHIMHQALYRTAGFASFRTAHQFPDCLGDVDVVSDSENIKRLLKLPYTTKGTISMVVHKVGNTLLLDEFDIQSYILGGAGKNWSWLHKLIMQNIIALEHKDQTFSLRDKSRDALRRKNLLSKFLYYSLGSPPPSGSSSSSSSSTSSSNSSTVHGPKIRCREPVLPDPNLEEYVPDAQSSHDFNRNVVWTFEDIRMMIGTDMPIFGGPNRPCISLRLRDMAEPINVLTGIDYWLDNLMCNVPEVLMCYHLDGIVQKYEIIKTEDLPYMEGSQFSPQVVRDVAQNILSFLKANATKAGHTYWLFKGRNDDVVKLYDLSTLCQQTAEPDGNHHGCHGETQDNPFTVPVAMLLYTVARNMKTSKVKPSPKAAGTIRALLQSCVKLLPKKQHPQIVTAAHYMLSDLFLPAYIDPKDPKFEGDDDDSDATSIYDDDDDADDDDYGDANNENDDDDDEYPLEMNNNGKKSSPSQSGPPPIEPSALPAALQRLEDNMKVFDLKEALGARSSRKGHAPEPLVADIVDRCKLALRHINGGLSCLEYFNAGQEEFLKDTERGAKDDEQRERALYEQQNPTMADECTAIPMPYELLGGSKPSLFDYPLAYSTYTQTETEIIMPQQPGKHHKIQQQQQKMQLQLLLKENKSNNNNASTNNKNIAANRKREQSEAQKNNDTPKAKDSKVGHKNKIGSTPEPLPTLTAEQILHHLSLNYNSQLFGSWNTHLKMLLLEKACLTYTTLAENCYKIGHYGTSLKSVYMAYRCQELIFKTMRRTMARRSCLLCLAGDCFFEMYRNWEQVNEFISQFHTKNPQDKYIEKVLDEEPKDEEACYLAEPVPNMEAIMLSCCLCYENALKMVDVKNSLEDDESFGLSHLLRRMGNIRNELALKYMNWASFSADENHTEYIVKRNEFDYSVYYKPTDGQENEKPELPSSLSMTLAMKAYDNLVLGIKAFSRVDDPVNSAFLFSNMGRFMRFRGHLQAVEDASYTSQETLKKFYTEALKFYDEAKLAMDRRESNPYLWDLVIWEHGTAIFMLAKHLQDEGIPQTNAVSDQVDLEREILQTLHKALAFCEVNNGAGRRELYDYRSGQVHKRIALFHFNVTKRVWIDDETMPKNNLQLCKSHHEKAAAIFHSLIEFSDEMAVHLERVDVFVYLTDKATNVTNKIKNLQGALEVCLNLGPLFEHALAFFTDGTIKGDYKTQNHQQNADFPEQLVQYVEMLQLVLRRLIKLFVSNVKDPKKAADGYKDMYKETLQMSKLLMGDQKPSIVDMVHFMIDTLDRLTAIDKLMLGPDTYVKRATEIAATHNEPPTAVLSNNNNNNGSSNSIATKKQMKAANKKATKAAAVQPATTKTNPTVKADKQQQTQDCNNYEDITVSKKTQKRNKKAH